MVFYDLTILGTGDRYSKRVKESADIDAKAIRMMRRVIDGGGGEIPFDGLRHIHVKWTVDPARPGTALATFYSHDDPLTTSALLTDSVSPADARYVLKILQGMVQQIWRSTPSVEPGFDLLAITERPVIATFLVPGAPVADLPLVADMETCLAAAFFES